MSDLRFTDLLFQRYSSPLVLLNGMIQAKRFSAFVRELLDIYNEEQEHKTLWDIWLHRVYDKSYPEFRQSIGVRDQAAAPSPVEIASTIQDSKSILNAFVPKSKEVNRKNGTVQAAGNNST